MESATMLRMHWRRFWLPSKPPCLPERKTGPESSLTHAPEGAKQPAVVHRLVCSWSCMVLPRCSLLLRSRLECQRRIWFVHNAGLTIFEHHNALLWGRDLSSLDADGKALGRVVLKNFGHRNTIIHPHVKMVDGTLLDLLENLIVHRIRPFSRSF